MKLNIKELSVSFEETFSLPSVNVNYKNLEGLTSYGKCLQQISIIKAFSLNPFKLYSRKVTYTVTPENII